MPRPGEKAKSDYITGAARTYRVLGADEVPADHPVFLFQQIYKELAGPDGVIERSAFNPARHVRLLQWIQLFERSPEGRFKVRLMGTGVARLIKGDFTGWYLDDYVSGDLLEHRLTEFTAALKEREPQLSMSVIQPDQGPEWTVYRGAYPARKDGRDLVFVVIAPDSERLAPSLDAL